MAVTQSHQPRAAFARTVGGTPAWRRRVLAGEITELHLLTALGICRTLRLLPEVISVA